jgi:hypothetical protein
MKPFILLNSKLKIKTQNPTIIKVFIRLRNHFAFNAKIGTLT